MPSDPQFDRTTQDVGNILSLEHVNTTVPDQLLAQFFYVTGMGFTRDPYMDFGLANMWINLGEEQFHLPVRDAQVLRGHTGIVVPSIADLKTRLSRVEKPLNGTEFSWAEENEHLSVTCPWGNQLKVFGPGAYGDRALGMPYVRFDVPVGTAAGIARFYEQVMGAPSAVVVNAEEAAMAQVAIGCGQKLEFSETDATLPDYDGHHVAVYVANLSRAHGILNEHGLVTEDTIENQYRFQTIFDPDSGDALFEIEHEVRSLHHPMHERNLVNRNATQSFATYQRGGDAFVG